MADAVMSDATARSELAAELASYNIAVAQPTDGPLFTKTPQSSMVPWHWRAADLARLLEKIGASLKLEAGGQRRTLRLANPGLPYGTTPTFWASIQYILPGEVATAHRHAATALRFIMEGSGSDTVVDGELYSMCEGDLVLTPSWSWHDHENKSSEPMVWLDVLDISAVRALHATFFEGSEEPRRQVSAISDRSFREFGSGIMRPVKARHDGPASPVLAYTRDRAMAALESAAGLEPDPYDDVLLEYQNPLTGGPALPTIGTMLQMLRPGVHTSAHRHTGSVVYYVCEGRGSTLIDDKRFDWGRGDFIALPPWARHEHLNASTTERAVLFQVNDLPILKALGLYREQPADGGSQREQEGAGRLKLVSFDGGRIGIVDGDEVVDISEVSPVPVGSWPPVAMVSLIAGFAEVQPQLARLLHSGKRQTLKSVRLECPVQWPNKVIAYPANYHAHVAEMITGTGLISKFKADGQGFFLKANSSLSGPADPIVLPRIAGREIHHECELAIIIGKGGRDITRDDALAHIFGYSCLLDIVVRGKEERVMRKSYDTFCPVGPWITTADEVPDPTRIEMALTVNGELRQQASTANLIVDIPAMIEMASAVMTLYPGDVIATGTPAGVGPIKAGDVLEITIAHVGAMALDVVQGAGGGHAVWNKPAG